uniref:C2H2-type domain-containing protein n=1 Tax=Anopheles dirus TaxID=7168 RepID=A0A182N2Z2_9DIPT
MQACDRIHDFESFKLNYKHHLELKNDDGSEWRCAETSEKVFLYVCDDGVPPAQSSSLDLDMARLTITIDRQLNVQFSSKNERVPIFLNDGERLNYYSQLNMCMCVLTEPSYEEEYLQEDDAVNEPKTQQAGKYRCSYCQKSFHRPVRWQQHENAHSGARPFVCRVCSRAFSSSSTLQAHAKLHDGVRTHRCPDCDRTFHRSTNLKLHYRTVHLKEKPYTCPICYRPYTDRTCLKRHIERHSEQNSTKVSKRGTGSAAIKAPDKESNRLPSAVHRAERKTERRKRNTLPKKYACELCGQSFARRRNVEFHMRYTHTGIKPHKCELCGKQYTDITSFKRHIREHSEQVERCQ